MMKAYRLFAMAVAALFLTFTTIAANPQSARWSEQKAQGWYAKQPWPVGANYIPRSAINQLEMWQASTFDPKEIDLWNEEKQRLLSKLVETYRTNEQNGLTIINIL